MKTNRRTWVLESSWPTYHYVFIILLTYSLYLPFSGYDTLPWDAEQYWQLVSRFFIEKKNFSILNYDANLRGYTGPLLILPVRAVWMLMGWNPMNGSRLIGLFWACIFYGIAIPGIWQQALQRPMMAKVWGILVLLGFIFWRGYFNFCIQDFPAFTMLLLSLVALSRSGLGWIFLGGVFVAIALNMRPIYLASLPGVLGWFWWQVRRQRVNSVPDASQQVIHGGIIALVFLAGVTGVLLPQTLINYQHFGQFNPLVLATDNGHMPFYLKQLNWGTAFQRYDSSIDPSHYGGVLYGDHVGRTILSQQPLGYFDSYWSFIRHCLLHPVQSFEQYFRHIFNGLDVYYPTPYPGEINSARITLYQVLNYAIVGSGIILLVLWLRRGIRGKHSHPVGWLLLAILLLVAVAIPTAVEVRFLMPLHILLLSVVAYKFQPKRMLQMSATQMLFSGVILLTLTWGGYLLSVNTMQQILPPGTLPPGY